MNEPRGEHAPRREGTAADGIDFSRLDRAALIRSAADGEAPPEIVEQLDRDEGARDAIAGERALRDRIAKVMGGESAPAELRAAVQAMFAREEAEQREAALDPATGEPPQTRSRSFWARRTVLSTLAAAAAVALATLAGVVFIANRAGSPLLTDVIGFVEREHDRCADIDSDYFERKMSARDASQAASLVRDTLGVAGPSLSLSQVGLALAGAGRCHVPGPGPSSHIVYRPSDADADAPYISLFLQVDTGAMPLRENVCYDFVCGPGGRDRLAVWRRNGLLYYAYCPGGAEQMPTQALQALGAPSERVSPGA